MNQPRVFVSDYILLQNLVNAARDVVARAPFTKSPSEQARLDSGLEVALVELDARIASDDANKQIQDAIRYARMAESDSLEIADQPLTSVGVDNGVWIQAWIWIHSDG